MDEKISALILSAGYGTRLRPLTYTIPKCLIKIGNVPILGRWISALKKCNAKNIVINTHYHHKQVHSYINSLNISDTNLTCFYEKELLGTAGTLLANREVFNDGIGLLIHGDNATDVSLCNLIHTHEKRPKNCILTMLTFTTTEPKQCGIVQINSDNIVTSFEEKSDNPSGNRANGAIYVFDKSLFDFIDDMENIPTDFSKDVLPRLVGRIITYHTDKPYVDIGTPDRLKLARSLWPNS